MRIDERGMRMAGVRNICFGVGINDVNYKIVEHDYNEDGKRYESWKCPFYIKWYDMLRRCYSKRELLRYPSYKNCGVNEDWLLFSNFKSWMETQDWEGKHLDKDLLVSGNKIYSPKFCIFLRPLVNTFMTDSTKIRGKYLIGVSYHKRDKVFTSTCNNPFTHKKEHLGYFNDEMKAHLAWKKRKHELACQLAESETDERIIKALTTRYL